MPDIKSALALLHKIVEEGRGPEPQEVDTLIDLLEDTNKD